MSSTAQTHPAEAAPPRRRPALSPSRANDFRRCPLLYRFRAVDRLPERRTPSQVRGTLVHAVLEDLHALPASDRTPATATGMLEPTWRRLQSGSADLAEVVPDDALECFLDGARDALDAYFEMEDPTSFESESRELHLETESADGVPLRGFVDRIDVSPTGGIRVIDYKTGRAPRAGLEQSALFQMKFYALMLLRTRGVVADELRLMYLGSREILTYTPDHDELVRFGGMLGALWRAVLEAGASGDFEPSPGPMCRFCDHRDRCPAFGGTPPAYAGWPDATTPEE